MRFIKMVAICLNAPGETLILSDVIAARLGKELNRLSTRPSGIPCTMGFLLASGGFMLKGRVFPSHL